MYESEIRDILSKHGRLSDIASLTDESDLYTAGLTSLVTVNLMLALEDHFNVEFPNRMLSRRTFGRIQTIAESIEELLKP
jgi:acyl carrier protein